jgi:serine/threonine-protein kinase RCK2
MLFFFIAKDLITHLLCVDPAQRYTIDEFLNHPWCKSAPTPTPAVTPRPPSSEPPIDSPLLQSYVKGERGGRSPGLSTLKEAFDITYAVHRMGEEGARRRAGHGRAGFHQGVGGRWLQGLNEEVEGVDDEKVIEEAKRRHGEPSILGESLRRKDKEQGREREKNAAQASIAGHGTAKRKGQGGAYDGRADGRAGPRDQGQSERMRFELDIDNATLIGRRHQRGASTVTSPLALFRKVDGPTVDAPQSPMHT